MRTYSNQAGVPLSLSVFLATDTYDGKEDDTLSATTLLKPVRQVILSDRVPQEHAVVDVLSLIKSRMGTAIHDSIEKSWTAHYKEAMTALGYPARVIDRVIINPAANDDLTDKIPVYMEQRRYKEVEGVRVSGKFDFVAEGRIEDFKSTSVNTWINNNKDEDYVLQGSIYRWLSPDIITQDTMAIQFIFWDWQPGRAKTDPKYPARPTMQRTFKLMSLQETEAYVAGRIRQLKQLWKAPEQDLPLCTDKELWRRAPQWKYYKNPAKTTRSTKNFDNKQDAFARLAEDKHVGIVKEAPGEVVACKYCPAFPICSQKDQLIASGDLKL
ncbi:PD-(D/E)XK nuclease family protein [Vreelandella venusta]|uniref:PD-(D/E)XK nuclease family protein n=1 Tax=Vreelandella venusta TaxID=44935 RepID=UPI001173A292|nr:PD-(D/E)XK nuclease family protein [Halomonas venusta]GEK52338.1 hypothetical protein HVE01_30590 [Halomonas venusta]